MSKKKSPVRAWIDEYKEQFERYNRFCTKVDWRDIKPSEIEQKYIEQENIVSVIVDRLKYFVNKFEPYLEYEYVISFMELMNIPVKLYLDRCNSYFKNNDWTTIKDDKKKIAEMNFQTAIMTDYNKVKDKLQALNLDDSVVSVDLPIHSDKKIPFLMASLAEEKFPQIKEFKKIIEQEAAFNIKHHTAYDIINSTEMFINIKNPPIYDANKHYFEQKPEVLQFYEEEFKKITKGVTIAGVFIHPWLYWHINFFKTDIPMDILEGDKRYNPSKTNLITTPFLRDNELFIADCYQEADDSNVGLFFFGTRRYGKTVIEASILSWRVTITENTEALVIGGDKGDLEKLSKSLEICFSNINSAFELTRNNNDWKSHIQFGLKNKTQKKIPYGDIFIRNVDGGTAKSSEKTAGATPTAWIVDEAGKFMCKAMYQAAIPSFGTTSGWSVVPIMTGTGGNKILSADAQDMLMNPLINRILPMNWDRLDNMVKEKDLITWKRRDFGIYLPAQMSFKPGLKKIETNMADYMDVDDKQLRKIDLMITDWENSKKIIDKDRALLDKDRDALNKEKMYHPLDPLECFLNRIENPFCAVEAEEHKQELVSTGRTGRPVTISRDMGTTNLKLTFSDKKIASFPFKEGNIDAPVIIYEDPPDDNTMDGTNVAGLDHYKHDKSSTDSIGSAYIFKRNVNLNDEWGHRIVASYASRPDRIEIFNQKLELLLEGYGAECLQENADISFQIYLRMKNKEHLLLANGEELARSRINTKAVQNNKYGLNPNPKNQQYLLNLVINYCNEDIEIGEDEEGNKIIVKGVTRIPDIYLLEEIIGFNYTGNFDRITAFGHALAWARYLDFLRIMPEPKIRKEDSTYQKQLRKNRHRHNSPYSTRRNSPYSLRKKRR